MKKVRVGLIILLLLIALGAAAYLGVTLWQRAQSQQKVDDLIQQKESAMPSPTAIPSDASATPSPTAAPATASPAAQQVLAQYAELHEKNPDLVAWVKIDGTKIDYPIMQRAGDDEFYLYRDFDGQEDVAGLPFLDGRCSLSPRTTNLLVHGHNMKDGSMFHNLRYYKKESYYKEHPIIRFDTMTEQAEYEIFAVVQSRVFKKDEKGFRYYQFIQADTKEAFDQAISEIKKLCKYDTNITPEYGDELLTLSTCDYDVENGRLALVARKVKAE